MSQGAGYMVKLFHLEYRLQNINFAETHKKNESHSHTVFDKLSPHTHGLTRQSCST